MANLQGSLIAGRYLVNSLLASGGMASVYLAKDNVLERKVALKVIHPHLAGDKSFIEKFRREAKVAAKLSHPNLVNVFDQGTDGSINFLVMEYIPGITLRDAMNDFGPLEPNRALEILEPLTAGLAAAHAAGILHRDLKPENVLLSDDGSVKLGDFGLARAISQHTQTGSIVGTVAYLSPELVLRGQADARSDVYSLGVLMFEMLTGTQPYQGEQAVQVAYQHANDQVPAPSSLKAGIPELLDEIVLWATAREANHRPESAAELLPVINRARTDLARGLTTSLADIDKTAMHNFEPTITSAPGVTEVIDADDLDRFAYESSNASKLRRSNKRSRFWLTIVTLLAIFGGAGSGWWFSAGPGGLAAVPELAGRDLQQAVSALEALGLAVVKAEENSESVPEGFVTRTEPAAGSRAFKNSSVTVYLSVGPKQLKVPDVLGLGVDDAAGLLTEKGFSPGQTKRYFNQLPAGQVFDLSAEIGSVINQSSVIDLLVSLGPLPEVSGLDLDTALKTLEGLPLVVEQVQLFDNSVPAGQVIQLKLSESPLPEGGTVQLEISKGPEIVAMPSVSGETIAAAKQLLENLGLRVVIDTNQLSSNFGIAKVKSQSPKAGVEVRVGDSVTIISR